MLAKLSSISAFSTLSGFQRCSVLPDHCHLSHCEDFVNQYIVVIAVFSCFVFYSILLCHSTKYESQTLSQNLKLDREHPALIRVLPHQSFRHKHRSFSTSFLKRIPSPHLIWTVDNRRGGGRIEKWKKVRQTCKLYQRRRHGDAVKNET